MLYENGHPPNHTAGGINMNFFPVGPLVRRSGVFFIRRSFKDDPVYKFVLRHYIDYLIEKRFSLEWYIEGGRSRSGKLLPPRFGLLAYVVDAYRRGKSDDVVLIPVSIAYDQITDVPDYAAEQSGRAPSSARASAGSCASCAGSARRYGEIHIAFGEPLSLAKALGPPDPQRAAGPRRAEPRAAEARLRGVRAHQPGHADHADLAGRAGGARRGRPRADGRRRARAAREPALRRRAAAAARHERRRARDARGRRARARGAGRERRGDALRRGQRVRLPDRARTSSSPPPTTATPSSTSSSNPAISELALLRAAEAGGADPIGGVLPRRDAAARPAQVRVLLRGQGALPRRAAPRARRARSALGGRAARVARGDPGAGAALPALQLAPRAAALPRGLPRGGGPAGAPGSRRAGRPREVPGRLHGRRPAVPPAGSPALHGVDLAGALRGGAAPGREPRAARAGSARAGALARAFSRRDPRAGCGASTPSTRWPRAAAPG